MRKITAVALRLVKGASGTASTVAVALFSDATNDQALAMATEALTKAKPGWTVNGHAFAHTDLPHPEDRGDVPWAYGWFDNGGTKRVSPYLPTNAMLQHVEGDAFPLYQHADPETIEQAVEAAARRIHAGACSDEVGADVSWNVLADFERQHYRNHARAALNVGVTRND